MNPDSTANEQASHGGLWSDLPEQQAEALQRIATHGPICVDTARCVSLAGSRHDEVRMWAADALESAITPRADEVAALTDLLSPASDGESVYWAATMLGRLGADAESAVSALEQCLRGSPYLPARERAAGALRRIGGPAASALPTLQSIAAKAPARLQRLAANACDAIRSEMTRGRAA